MQKQITIQLSLAMVESGGNTGDGKYFYSFTPGLLHIDKDPALLTYQFAPETPANFQFVGAYACDPKLQLGPSTVSSDKRSVTMLHFNTVSQLALLSFLIVDTTTESFVTCDPQVTNAPGHTN